MGSIRPACCGLEVELGADNSQRLGESLKANLLQYVEDVLNRCHQNPPASLNASYNSSTDAVSAMLDATLNRPALALPSRPKRALGDRVWVGGSSSAMTINTLPSLSSNVPLTSSSVNVSAFLTKNTVASCWLAAKRTTPSL